MPCDDDLKRRPAIEPGDCILCEICADVCPDVFSVNAVGYIVIADLIQYPESCVDEAIRNCPEDCISWEADF